MATIQLALNGLGPSVQGGSGKYQAGTDGTATVDTRDAPALLQAGAAYVRHASQIYTTYPISPATAAVGKFIASATFAVGTLTILAQPDVMRPARVVLVPGGSPGVTSGTLTVTYIANDGGTQVDVINPNIAGNTTTTYYLTKGVQHITSAIISGTVTGGSTPKVSLDSTADLSVPVDPGAVDVVFTKETPNTGDESVGASLTNVLASLTPTTAPNASITYSIAYTFTSPQF